MHALKSGSGGDCENSNTPKQHAASPSLVASTCSVSTFAPTGIAPARMDWVANPRVANPLPKRGLTHQWSLNGASTLICHFQSPPDPVQDFLLHILRVDSSQESQVRAP
eukprot:1493704-Amphidinium_carterae.2